MARNNPPPSYERMLEKTPLRALSCLLLLLHGMGCPSLVCASRNQLLHRPVPSSSAKCRAHFLCNTFTKSTHNTLRQLLNAPSVRPSFPMAIVRPLEHKSFHDRRANFSKVKDTPCCLMPRTHPHLLQSIPDNSCESSELSPSTDFCALLNIDLASSSQIVVRGTTATNV